MTLAPQVWVKLPREIREALAKIFRLTPSGFTHVVDNQVETDGFSYKDLQPMNVEAMKELTHLESNDFEEQFALILKMVDPDKELTLQKNGTYTEGISGTNPQTQEGEGRVIPVSGTEQQVNPGRTEFLSGSGDSNTAGLPAKDEEVHVSQPEVGKDAGPKKRGRKAV